MPNSKPITEHPNGPSQGAQLSHRKIAWSDRSFVVCLGTVTFAYLAFILLLVGSNLLYMITDAEWNGWKENPIIKAMAQEEIRNSVILSLISCTLSAFFSIAIAIPLGYYLKGKNFPGRMLLDAILDIPIVLPPLVIGLSLLILFQFPPFTQTLIDILPFIDDPNMSANSLIVYQVPAVIIAQTTVASAFAVATLKGTFEQIDSRREQVALTLGCSRFQAFSRVVLPEAAPGVITAWTLSWARSLGEFGPLLIFAGATRNKTEVLSTTVFLEMSIGNLEGAVAVSLIMIIMAIIVLVITRIWGKLEVSL
jgi:molybdate transport system permease protein